MDLAFTPAQEAFREEVRTWLAEHVPTERLASMDTPHGFAEHREWERVLAAGGWSVPQWPAEYGGRGIGVIEWLIYEEEYWAAGAPGRVSANGVSLLAPTIFEFGTPEQRQRFLPPMGTGEEIWAQGWSEPNAGSDMAAIRASARLEGDRYVLSGQKTWCSRAAFADWLFGIFRTDPASERHRGLSFILVSLRTPGVTVRPIVQLDGETGFAEVFFDDARVPREQRVGPEHEGWRIAMATAGFERGLMLRSPARFQATARRLVELYRVQADTAGAMLRDAVVSAWMDAEAYALATYRTAARLLAGGRLGVEASCNKIFWSELDLRMHETAMSLLGARAELLPAAPAAGDVGRWLDGFLFSLAGPIYAGTNEIQRNVIAERLLGLPKG
jgi:alkylation response protein AidB-like acyl-CoA dehydrogenase